MSDKEQSLEPRQPSQSELAQAPCSACGNVGRIDRFGIGQCDACGFPLDSRPATLFETTIDISAPMPPDKKSVVVGIDDEDCYGTGTAKLFTISRTTELSDVRRKRAQIAQKLYDY